METQIKVFLSLVLSRRFPLELVVTATSIFRSQR